MKTKKFDSNWEKILTGEMTLEEWWEQAEDGPAHYIVEDALDEADEILQSIKDEE